MFAIRYWLCGVMLLLMAVPESAFAGHYRLVYWRERGLNENAGCGGHHVINIFVWDQNGIRLEGKQLRTTWGVLQATTNYEGYAQFVIDGDADRDVIVFDSPHTSDATPLFSVAHAPCNGHYSYEAGFMRVNAPGDLTIDQTTCGTHNPRGSSDNDAPYTRSLVFHSIDCMNRSSDAFTLANWSTSFAQTFRVPDNVNRLLGVQFQMTLGEGKVSYTIEIREDGPTGQVVYLKNTPYPYNATPWLTFFGLDECVVQPGRTYAVRLVRPQGMNTYMVTNDVYPHGSAWANDSPITNRELQGFVIGGARGQVVVPTATNTPPPTATFTPSHTFTPTATPTPSAPDIDRDGVPDAVEGVPPAAGQSHRYLPDSDGDGLLDGQEDTNANGMRDAWETNTRNRDSDGDGLWDGIEVKITGTDPLNANSPASYVDADGDGLPASHDLFDNNPDSDGDRFSDGYEAVTVGMSAVYNASVRPPLADLNNDGAVSNLDALMIQGLFLGVVMPTDPVFGELGFGNSDANRDGNITNLDALVVQAYFLNVLNSLPLQN